MDIAENFKKWQTDFICGHCFNHAGYDVQYAELELFDDAGVDVAFGSGFVILKCHRCAFLNMVSLGVGGDQWPVTISNEHDLRKYFDGHPSILISDWGIGDTVAGFASMTYLGQFPFGIDQRDNIQQQIRNDLIEAFNCLSVNAVNASVMMSRRVVQQITGHFGIDKKLPLKQALKELKKVEKEKITDELYASLIEVKNWGDSGAHPGKFDKITHDEARKVAELVLTLLENIFPIKDDVALKAKELQKMRNRKAFSK